MAAAAALGVDEEVFQVDAVGAVPCGEREEPHGEPDDSAVVFGDVGEDLGVVAEEALAQLVLGDLHLVQGALVVGQLPDQPQDGRDVVRVA